MYALLECFRLRFSIFVEKLAVCIFAIMAVGAICAQEPVKDINGKYYYRKYGWPMTAPDFDMAFPFSENLGLVKLNGKYGFIRNAYMGPIAIPIIYEEAHSFHEGLALVKVNGRYGFIDKKGEFVIQPTLEYAEDFSEGLALFSKNGKNGFIDKTGKIVIPPQIDEYVIGGFRGGRTITMSDDGTVRYLDKQGKYSPTAYQDLSYYSEGLASFRQNGRQGYMDATGKCVISGGYDVQLDFTEGLAGVRLPGKGFGFIDKKGKVVIDFQFDNVEEFKDGLSLVTKNGKKFWIDRTGRKISDYSDGDDNDPKKIIYQDYVLSQLYLLLDSDEKDHLYSERLFAASRDGKRGFKDSMGNYVIEPQYSWADNFVNGLAHVKKEGKAGYIDVSGREVIPIMYEYGRDFSEGLAGVSLNGKWGFIDGDNNFVIQPQFDGVKEFRYGLSPAKSPSNGKWGYINKFGTFVVSPLFDEVGLVDYDGTFMVAVVIEDCEERVIIISPIKWEYYDNLY